MDRREFSGTACVLYLVLVLVNNSPVKATNKVGAAAITILLLDLGSGLRKGQSIRMRREEVESDCVHSTVMIANVMLAMLVLVDVLLYTTVPRTPVRSIICRVASTITAMKLDEKLAPYLGATNG